jgi:FixJ family two-component response regulator
MNTAPVVRIVDNDHGMLVATARLLASAGIASQSSSSPADFLEARDTKIPGCVILDVEMPECDGLALQEMLLQMAVALPVVFVTGRSDVAGSIRAMQHGAVDFLTKPVQADALLEAVGRGIEADRMRREREADGSDLRARLAMLTRREHEIMQWLLSGRLNKQIAGDLGIVETTVKVHRTRIMHKLGVHSLAELVYLAERAGVHAPTRVGCVANSQ